MQGIKGMESKSFEPLSTFYLGGLDQNRTVDMCR